MTASWLYPDFARSILSVVPIFSVHGTSAWAHARSNPATLTSEGSLVFSEDPRVGYILRRDKLDQAIASFVISKVFNASWIWFSEKTVDLIARDVLFYAHLAFRVNGTPETDLEMMIAPLELCEYPNFD